MMPNDAGSRPTPSRKYLAKQEAIVLTAAEVFNRLGVGEATLADVASDGKLQLTGIRHYFTRKDELVAAAYSRALAFHEELLAEASAGKTALDRLGILVRAYFREQRLIAEGAAPQYLHFGDLRALQAPFSDEVKPRYVAMFRALRDLLVEGDWRDQDRQVMNARAHLVLSHFLWSVVWLQNYDPADFPRVAERMMDILVNGIMAPKTKWRPQPVELAEDIDTDSDDKRSPDAFLKAATEAINAEGYHNASVDRISARLNVTKGSFYHHVEGKGDLVVACFERTFDILRSSQRAALDAQGPALTQGINAAAGLVRRQLTHAGPLLRTSALTAVDPVARRRMTQTMDAVTRRFADMVTDGMIDGSARVCDTAIAGQMITGIVNASEETERWVPDVTTETVLDIYLKPLFAGLYSTS